MMKIIIYIFIFSYSISSPALCQSGSSVALSGRTQMNFGIDFAMINMETDRIYYSKRISLFHPRCMIINNLPPGSYRLYLFSWSSSIGNINNPIHKYFGIFEFKEDKSYYLGNFVGNDDKEGLYYTVVNTRTPKRLIKTFRKRMLINKETDIIKTYPYNSDTLRIDSKFLH